MDRFLSPLQNWDFSLLWCLFPALFILVVILPPLLLPVLLHSILTVLFCAMARLARPAPCRVRGRSIRAASLRSPPLF